MGIEMRIKVLMGDKGENGDVNENRDEDNYWNKR